MVTAIKCAHCKGYHPSVSEVKVCSTIHQAKVVFQEPVATLVPNPRTQRLDVQVPEGRYAIEIDGTWKFYSVRRPTEGRWKGRTFVDQQVSDDFVPTFSRFQRETILNRIAQDPRKAMIDYGLKIGSCGVCGRTLTNEESRAAGIGPVCRQQFNFMF